jgi:hypothetical protein
MPLVGDAAVVAAATDIPLIQTITRADARRTDEPATGRPSVHSRRVLAPRADIFLNLPTQA